MAQSDRVAGIYSEIKYKFDPKSVKNLRRFKRDLVELKTNLRDIKKLTRGSVKLGFSTKNAKAAQQVARQTKAVNKDSLDTVKALGKQNKLRENSVKLQANITRKQKAASDAAVTKSGKVWKQREKFEKFEKDRANAAVNRAAAVWKQREKMEKFSRDQAEAAREAKKKELALDSKIAAQRSKVARMSGMARDRGNITPSSLNRIRQAQERLNRAYRNGSISASQFSTQSQRLTGILQRQSRAAKETTMSFNQMRTAVAGATGAYSAFAGAAGVKNIGGDFEDASIMLETAFGSEAEAVRIMDFLIDQSKRLGIGATETAKGFARYSLAGKQMGFTNEELQEQFLGVAEAATVFGLRQDEITGTIRALEQIASKGQVMAEELKLQLGDRMPAVLSVAAKAMNMEMKEFTKAMEQGEIGAKEFLPVFTAALREMAAPGLDKSFKTMNVAWKRMTQNFNLFVKALFESGVGDLFTKIFNTLSDIFQMAAPVVSLIGAFASTILKVLIFPIRLAIAMVRDMVVMIDWWMKDTFGTGLNELLKNIGTIGGYLVSLFSSLWSIIGKILKPIGWLVGKIGGLFKQVSPTYNLGKQALSGRSEQIGMITGAFKDAGGRAAEIGKGVMKSRYTQGAAVGELGGQAGNYIFTEANIKLRGRAAEIFEQDTRAEITRAIGSNVQG